MTITTRARMSASARDHNSGRRRNATLLNIALLFLTGFSTSVHAAKPERVPHFPRQNAEFNVTTAVSLISSPSQDIFLFSSSMPCTPSHQSATKESLLLGGTFSAAGDSRIGRTTSTTSDDISSQISSTSIAENSTNGTSRVTGVVSTSQLSNLAFTENLSNPVPFTSPNTRNTFLQVITLRNNTSTASPTQTSVSISTINLIPSVRPAFPAINVSISASPSGSSSKATAKLTKTVEAIQLVTFTVPTGFEPDEACISTSDGQIPTTISIVYTSTTTFYGNPADYTAPYPTIATPVTCSSGGLGAGDSRSSTASNSFSCDPSGVCTSALAGLPSIVLTMSPPKINPITTFTFVTTAKNPSVVYSPISTPRYGHGSVTRAPQDRHTALKPADNASDRPQPPLSGSRENTKERAKGTYTVTIAPTKVIINDQTFTVETPSVTTQVTVGGAQFTINPSEVVGGGTIVDRPGNVGRSTIAPSSTMVEGISVVIAPQRSQNVVVVGGTTFELQPTPVTVVVQGQTITIQASGIVFPKQTVPISRSTPEQTEIVVAGGEMMTAIGPTVVVIRSTTFTYGLVSSMVTERVDDDTILIGPSGVVVHNMTMGGPNAKPSDTTYEIVGGATMTQVGASLVVVGGATFTVGPGQGTTTTVIGGETITIGPSGIAVSTLSFPYPFGPTVITTISAPTTIAVPAPRPSETKTNGGAGVRHARYKTATRLHLEFCIAITVWVLGLTV